jgi:hypothetical protein
MATITSTFFNFWPTFSNPLRYPNVRSRRTLFETDNHCQTATELS